MEPAEDQARIYLFKNRVSLRRTGWVLFLLTGRRALIRLYAGSKQKIYSSFNPFKSKWDILYAHYVRARRDIGLLGSLYLVICWVWWGILRHKRDTGERLFYDRLAYRIRRKSTNCQFDFPPYGRPDSNTIVLIYFIGLGDYLYTTPMLVRLRKAYPNHEIIGAVSGNKDQYNNPLVGQLLERNPNIDKVISFSGEASFYWRAYNWDSLVSMLGKNIDYFPVLYEAHDRADHRVSEVEKVFGFRPMPVPGLPEVYLDDKDRLFARAALKRFAVSGRTPILIHMEARSSGYVYPRTNELLELLVKNHYLPIVFCENLDPKIEGIEKIRTTDWSLHQSFALVAEMGKMGAMICISSVFFPVTAAFRLPTLGIYMLEDKLYKQFEYDSLMIIRRDNSPNESCVKRGIFYDFLPEEILRRFQESIEPRIRM